MARKVRIEEGLYVKLEKAAAAAGYPGADEFVVHLLEKAVAGVGDGDDGDSERVKEQLRGLGYLS